MILHGAIARKNSTAILMKTLAKALSFNILQESKLYREGRVDKFVIPQSNGDMLFILYGKVTFMIIEEAKKSVMWYLQTYHQCYDTKYVPR